MKWLEMAFWALTCFLLFFGLIIYAVGQWDKEEEAKERRIKAHVSKLAT